MGVEEVNRKENPTQSTPFMSLFVGLKQKKANIRFIRLLSAVCWVDVNRRTEPRQ